MHLWWQALDGVAGGLNIAYGAVDRHVVHGRSACAVRVLRRQRPRDGELLRKTNRFANALRAFGVTGAKPVARLYFLFPRHGGF